MKTTGILLSILLPLLPGGLHGATVNFSAGGSTDTILFETVLGDELIGGTLFAGTFDSPPSVGITLADVISNYLTFDELDAPSGAFGNFGGNFFGNVEPSLGGKQIYLIAVNSTTIDAATEFAVFTSSDPSWRFPGDDGSAPPSSITLVGTVDQFFAGAADTITDPGGIPGTFNSIRLQDTSSVPLVAPDVLAIVISGQSGIEFDYPSAEAGSVTFTLQSSDTLLPGSFSDVTATPSVINDDGTTRTIRILHPDPVSGQPRRFLRLKVSAP